VQKLKEINEKVGARDLLICNYDERNQKRKTRARLLLQQYKDMVKNGFVNPSKFLTKEELILIEEEKLRQNLCSEKELRALKKNKEKSLNSLKESRTKTDEESREMLRLEHDLVLIEEKLRERN